MFPGTVTFTCPRVSVSFLTVRSLVLVSWNPRFGPANKTPSGRGVAGLRYF